MTNGNNDVRELEDLLTELEGQGALPVGAYSEEDDAVTQLMDAPLGEQEWMIQITPHDRRMMSTEQLLSELGTGVLVSSDMLVWRSGMGDWAPISSIDELRAGRPSERRGPPAPLPSSALPSSALPSPAPLPPPAPVPPRVGSSTMVSPSPNGRAPLPPAPSVPFGMRPPTPVPPVPPPPASLPLSSSPFGAPAPAPAPMVPPASPIPEFSPSYNSPGASTAPSVASVPPPAVARVNTQGPVAVDFSEMEPPRSSSMRTLVGSGIAAVLMIASTVYALSAGGVFEADPAISSEAPAAASAPAPAASLPAPAPQPADPAPEASAAAKPAEAAAEESSGAEEPQTQPASVKDDGVAAAAAEKPAEAAADESEASENEAAEASEPSEPPSKSRRQLSKRKRESSGRRKAVAARKAPERRSAPRAVAASVPPRSTDAEESPKGGEPGGTFNKDAAKSALDSAASQVRNCRPAGGVTGSGRVQVRYEPNGKVGAVTMLTPTFANTTTGDCIVMVFRRASIPAFTGVPSVVMNKNFEIP